MNEPGKSKEVTTKQVRAVRFSVYTEEEVSTVLERTYLLAEASFGFCVLHTFVPLKYSVKMNNAQQTFPYFPRPSFDRIQPVIQDAAKVKRGAALLIHNFSGLQTPDSIILPYYGRYTQPCADAFWAVSL